MHCIIVEMFWRKVFLNPIKNLKVRLHLTGFHHLSDRIDIYAASPCIKTGYEYFTVRK